MKIKKCEICGKKYHFSKLKEKENIFFCQDCYIINYTSDCEICGKRLETDLMFGVNKGLYSDYYCEDCYTEHTSEIIDSL